MFLRQELVVCSGGSDFMFINALVYTAHTTSVVPGPSVVIERCKPAPVAIYKRLDGWRTLRGVVLFCAESVRFC